MALGNLDTNERGSGARFNDNKAPYDLIAWYPIAVGLKPVTSSQEYVRQALICLGEFQRGADARYLHMAMVAASNAVNMDTPEMMAEMARVLEYGKKKYSAWNWAKGMPWDSVIGCAARHLLGWDGVKGMWHDPGGDDEESGCMHVGHVACNLMFLLQFMTNYPEGDNRPKELRPPIYDAF